MFQRTVNISKSQSFFLFGPRGQGNPQKKASKFYLFDTDVARALARQVDYDLIPRSFEFGQLFEAFVVNELHRRLTYKGKQFKLSYLRVKEDLEIDLIIERGGLPPNGQAHCCMGGNERRSPYHQEL